MDVTYSNGCTGVKDSCCTRAAGVPELDRPVSATGREQAVIAIDGT